MIGYGNISLEALSLIEKFSVATEMKCFRMGFSNLQAFLDHWKEHGTFKMFEKSGDHLEIVMSNLCNKYALLPLMIKEEIPRETKLPAFIQKFDSIRKIMICQQIAIATCNCTVQTKNILAAQVRLIKNGEGILGLLYNEDFNFFKAGLGPQTCANLMRLKNRISALVLSLAESDNIGMQDARNKILKLYLKTGKEKELFAPEIAIDRRNKVAIFKLIDLLVNSGIVFSPSERLLFQSVYSGASKKDTDKGSDAYRPTQAAAVKNKLREDLYSYFYCLSFLCANDLSGYGMDLSADFIVVNADYIRTINERENVNFSRALYENILTVFFESTHHLLTGTEKAESSAYKSSWKKKWKASYIIKRGLVAAFKFEDFVAYIETVARAERIAPDFLHLEEVLVRFLDGKPKTKPERIKEICSAIVSNEFGLFLNGEGLLIFPSSVQKSSKKDRLLKNDPPPGHQCTINDIFNVIEQIGMPASIGFIVYKLKELFPNMTDDVLGIRSMILKNKATFFHIGNTGTYGLETWLKSGKNFKTEGLRAIAIEYLTQSDTLIDLDDLMTYIKTYRMITREDLLEYFEHKHALMFLKGNLVGLKRKKQHRILASGKTDVRQKTRAARGTLPVYLREILKDLGKVTSLSHILEELKERYPTLKVKESSVRTTLVSRKDDFFTVGKSGTYGLKAWEEDNARTKGGTIRDMAEEYLKNSSQPVKERDLFQYVAQYRNTTFRNMKQNLKLENGKTFVFFREGFVGLKYKEYSPEYKAL